MILQIRIAKPWIRIRIIINRNIGSQHWLSFICILKKFFQNLVGIFRCLEQHAGPSSPAAAYNHHPFFLSENIIWKKHENQKQFGKKYLLRKRLNWTWETILTLAENSTTRAVLLFVICRTWLHTSGDHAFPYMSNVVAHLGQACFSLSVEIVAL